MPLESSISDGTFWSITLESSITILDVSFTLIYDVYSTGFTYGDDCNMFKVHATVAYVAYVVGFNHHSTYVLRLSGLAPLWGHHV